MSPGGPGGGGGGGGGMTLGVSANTASDATIAPAPTTPTVLIQSRREMGGTGGSVINAIRLDQRAVRENSNRNTHPLHRQMNGLPSPNPVWRPYDRRRILKARPLGDLHEPRPVSTLRSCARRAARRTGP